jgi:hypothetical protein
MLFTFYKFSHIMKTMGKAKKRILHKSNSSLFMTRETAVSKVFTMLSKDNKRIEADNLITLFGLTAEELSEAGVPYEDLISLGSTIA